MKIQRESLYQRLEFVILVFLFGGVIGWIYEVILHLFSSGTFVNRGMLHGPWLPIYGFGCIFLTVIKKIIKNHPIRYFLVCMAVSGVLEYVTSWIMEVIYHQRWWDYSHLALNLHGRICAAGLVGFGLAGCIFAYYILPVIERRHQMISIRNRKGFMIVLMVIFILDVVVSLMFPNMGYGITFR